MIALLPFAFAAPWTTAATPEARIRGALATETLDADTPWRASVAAIGPLELVPGKRFLSPRDTKPFDTVVVSDEGATVRVAHEDQGVRVVVGVRREDLALRPDDRAPVHARPGVAPTNGDLELAGGTPVGVGAAVNGQVPITWSADGLTIDAWVPSTSIGPLWRITHWVLDSRAADLELVPGGGQALHDGPNGDVLATLSADVGLLLYTAGATRQGWRRVEVRTESVRGHGWLPAAAVLEVGAHGVGYGSGSGSPRANGTVVVLASGSAIHAEGGELAFGRALRDVTVQLLGTTGNTIRVSVPSAWGLLPGEVTCGRITKNEGEAPRCELRR